MSMSSPPPTDTTEQAKRNRLFWHSRRGMRELDLLLVPFIQEAYAGLDEKDQLLYEAFLRMEDQDMYNLLMQRVEITDPELDRIVTLIRQHSGN